MQTTDVQSLFDYMYWVNHRLLDAAASLSTAEFIKTDAVTTRDLRSTLVHELDVEWSWRLRLQGRSDEDEAELHPKDYPDLAALRAHWERDEAEMRAWLAALSDEDLARPATPAPLNHSFPLWQYLTHILVHAAQQQADAATLLSLAGQSPGELGYLEFLRGR
jgi:uncharacterized damage-inducible protein DinB